MYWFLIEYQKYNYPCINNDAEVGVDPSRHNWLSRDLVLQKPRPIFLEDSSEIRNYSIRFILIDSVLVQLNIKKRVQISVGFIARVSLLPLYTSDINVKHWNVWAMLLCLVKF
jgi:hypothetical protein